MKKIESAWCATRALSTTVLLALVASCITTGSRGPVETSTHTLVYGHIEAPGKRLYDVELTITCCSPVARKTGIASSSPQSRAR